MIESFYFIAGGVFASFVWSISYLLLHKQSTVSKVDLPSPVPVIKKLQPAKQSWFRPTETGSVIEPDRSDVFEQASSLKELLGE